MELDSSVGRKRRRVSRGTYGGEKGSDVNDVLAGATRTLRTFDSSHFANNSQDYRAHIVGKTSVRRLPDLQGMLPLSKSEVKGDLKEMEKPLMNGFATSGPLGETLVSSRQLLPDGVGPPPLPDSSYMERKKRLKRWEKFPALAQLDYERSQAAVDATRKELKKIEKEREDLELRYMSLRSHYMLQCNLLDEEKEESNQVLADLEKQVARRAATLEVQKRKNTALQNILLELKRRADALLYLRQLYQQQQNEIDYLKGDLPRIGSTITTFMGKGKVKDVRLQDRVIVVELKDSGAICYLQASPSLAASAQKEDVTDYALNWDKLEQEAQEEVLADDTTANADMEDEEGGRGRKKAGQEGLIAMRSCLMPMDSRGVPLRISPIGTREDRVIAMAPPEGSIQWFERSLPEAIQKWEDDKLELQKLRGEVERLKFKLSAAETNRKDKERQLRDAHESRDLLMEQLSRYRVASSGMEPVKKKEDSKKKTSTKSNGRVPSPAKEDVSTATRRRSNPRLNRTTLRSSSRQENPIEAMEDPPVEENSTTLPPPAPVSDTPAAPEDDKQDIDPVPMGPLEHKSESSLEDEGDGDFMDDGGDDDEDEGDDEQYTVGGKSRSSKLRLSARQTRQNARRGGTQSNPSSGAEDKIKSDTAKEAARQRERRRTSRYGTIV